MPEACDSDLGVTREQSGRGRTRTDEISGSLQVFAVLSPGKLM
jgi:hypothetical protein